MFINNVVLQRLLTCEDGKFVQDGGPASVCLHDDSQLSVSGASSLQALPDPLVRPQPRPSSAPDLQRQLPEDV